MTVGGKVLKEGDLISDRRLHRRSDGRPGRDQAERSRPGADRQDAEAGAVEGLSAVRRADELGRRGPQAARSAPTPTSPTRPTQAIAFGAEGIGLCRTEHMFFDHIEPMREMILAETPEDRKKALAKLLPFQRRTSRACSGR